MHKPVEFDISPYNFKGVIHIGAGVGESIKYYNNLGFQDILWIEEREACYIPLYNATKTYNIRQKYHFVKLSNDDQSQNCIRFHTFYRRNTFNINLFDYDLLHISLKDPHTFIKGFGMCLNDINAVLFSNGCNADVENILKEKKFKLELYTDRCFLFLKE